MTETGEPDAAQPTWSKPRRIGDGVMMCKPFALSSGEWVLPISRWREHDESAQMIVSADAGKTWTRRGGGNVPKEVRQFDEHMFVERKDGSLWLLVRTTYGIGESVSTDRGKTWPELKPSGILHTPSRFFIQRLASGNLLLVKHGPFDTRTSRSHLTAYLSKDEGKTWSGGLLLDERLGVSYPDGQQTPDGLIRIIYDYNRVTDRNILMATFREEDAAAGKPVSDAVRLRQLVSKATGGQEKPKTSTAAVHANADGKPLRTTQPGTLTSADLKPQPLVPGARLFTDRAYIAAELPVALAVCTRFVKPLHGLAFTFAVLAVGNAAVAYPPLFTAWGGFELKQVISPLVQVIIFGMGMTLTPDDFRRVLTMPRGVVLCCVLHYSWQVPTDEHPRPRLTRPTKASRLGSGRSTEPDCIAGRLSMHSERSHRHARREAEAGVGLVRTGIVQIRRNGATEEPLYQATLPWGVTRADGRIRRRAIDAKIDDYFAKIRSLCLITMPSRYSMSVTS